MDSLRGARVSTVLLRLPLILVSVLIDSSTARAEHGDLEDEETEVLQVTATRTPSRTSATLGSFSVLDGEEIRARGHESLGEALRHMAGLHLSQPGMRGSRASLHVRGADPNHVLVLVDGIRLNDPTNARGGSFDFATLGVDGIERVEIQRGPVSAVHGSDAIAGVVQVITKSGRGPDALVARAHGGRFGSYGAGGVASGERGPLALAVSGSYVDEGDPEFPAAFDQGSLHSRLDADLPGGISARGSLRFVDADSASWPDASGGEDFAIGLETRSAQEVSGNVEFSGSLFGASDTNGSQAPVSWSIGAGAYRRREHRVSPGVPFAVPAEDARDRLHRYSAAARGTWHAHDAVTITLGGDLLHDQGDSDTVYSGIGPAPFSLERTVGGPLAEVLLEGPAGLEIVSGLRVDFSNDLATQWTPRVLASIPIPRTPLVLHGGYGEGFKHPSFFALGNPIVGDSSLEAEKSRGWEIGLSAESEGRPVRARFAFFERRVDDLIVFDGASFAFVNLDSRHRGFELELEAELTRELWLGGQLAFVENDVLGPSATPLTDRPRWQGSLFVDWSPVERLRIHAEAIFVGDVTASSVPTGVVTLDAWQRVDLTMRYTLSEHIELAFGVKNLLDQEYEEAPGFPSVGALPSIGIRIQH